MSEVALFVHSTGIGPFMWTKLLADLPEGVQPLTPANRGYSLMDMLPRGTPISLADEVAHLKAQIPAGTTGVHLGGHSYGGLAALALAMDPAVPVRSIWLYEPVLFGSLKAELDADPASLPADAAEQVRALFGDPDALLNEETGGDDTWLERFVDYWNQPGMWASMPEKAKAMARMVGWKMFQEVRIVSQEPEAFGHYRLKVPTTLVYGEHTTPPAREMVRRLSEVNPDAEVVRLQGLGHMGLVGAPAAVSATLQKHWQRVAAAA